MYSTQKHAPYKMLVSSKDSRHSTRVEVDVIFHRPALMVPKKQSEKEDETYDIVIRGIQALQETRRAPASSEHNDGLLRGIIGQLRARMLIRLRGVVEDTTRGDDGDERNAAEGLEELAPSGDARERRGKGGRRWWLEM